MCLPLMKKRAEPQQADRCADPSQASAAKIGETAPHKPQIPATLMKRTDRLRFPGFRKLFSKKGEARAVCDETGSPLPAQRRSNIEEA
jgi:hypothetical protein